MTSWFLCNDAKVSYWQYIFSGIRSYRISSALIGVYCLTGVIMVAANLLSLFIVAFLIVYLSVCYQAIEQYVSRGRTMAVYIHFISNGLGPQALYTAFLSIKRYCLDLLIMLLKCMSNSILLSKVTPRYFTSWLKSISCPDIFSLFGKSKYIKCRKNI